MYCHRQPQSGRGFAEVYRCHRHRGPGNPGDPIPYNYKIPFYKYQHRIVLRNIGKIDPADIRDTIAVEGYQALAKALTSMTSEEVIAAIEAAGLRGGGGA